MPLSITILGCGSSGGVPRVGQGWGACDPENPKNRRRRCSLLVEKIASAGRTTVLVDTSPDLREQLLDAVWGYDRAVTDRTVDVYVLRLRQKIEAEGGRSFVRSVRGFGYSFNAEAPQEQPQ